MRSSRLGRLVLAAVVVGQFGVASPLASAQPAQPGARPSPAVDRQVPALGASTLTIAEAGDVANEPVVASNDVVDMVVAGGAVSVGTSAISVDFLEVGAAASASPTDAGAVAAPVQPPRVEVSVVDQTIAEQAGFDRMAFVVEPVTGSFAPGTRARMSIDYSSFRDAYGGDWAGRLGVVAFDACALDAGAAASCRETLAVDSVENDVDAGVISFEVEFASLLAAMTADGGTGVGGVGAAAASSGAPGFGLSAGAYSSQGNFATTGLNPTGAWSVGLQAGDFNYSYPFPAPEPPAGMKPDLSVSYSSQAVDGMTSDQNTQGGKAGPGWSLGDMFIEREFRTCSLDGGSAGDLCWVDNNATLSMGGVSGKLIYDGPLATGIVQIDRYRVSNAVGWVVKHFRFTDMSASKGAYGVDNDREYFQVLSPEGVSYWFGYGKMTMDNLEPGTALASVWTVPVIGNDTGEPCRTQTPNWCHQAYRWNLDRVVDVQGHAMTFQYVTEQNYYGTAGRPNDTHPYVSGGRLEIVNYGYVDAMANSVGAVMTNYVDLNYTYRCQALTAACAAPTSSSTDAEFPDIPTDMICVANQTCYPESPTFFDRYVLSNVATGVRTSATAMSQLATWNFAYDWVQPTTSDPQRLWLRRITPTGRGYGTAEERGDVQFDGPIAGAHANRADYNAAAGVSQMNHFRIGRIRDEFGGLIEVVYTQPKACPQGTWDTATNPNWQGSNYNTWSCFPRYWFPPGGVVCPTGTTPPPGTVCAGFSWWNKWVVQSVTHHDLTGRSPGVVKSYSYPVTNNPGTPNAAKNFGMAWHADTNELTPVGRRSWGEYRGFFEVRETVGTVGAADAMTNVYRFHRGMHGDLVSHSAGGTKSVTVRSSLPGGPFPVLDPDVQDDDWLNGYELESFVAASPAAAANQATDVSGVVTRYLDFQLGAGIKKAHWMLPQYEFRRASGTFSRTDFEYDPWARRTMLRERGTVTSNYAADANDAHGNADERCTSTAYTPTALWFEQGLPARTVMYGNATCGIGPVLSDVSTFYDGANPDPATATSSGPTNGEVTAIVRYTGDHVVDDTGAVVTTVTERFTYENNGNEAPRGWGRLASSTDARGKVTTYTYSSFGQPTSIDLSVVNVNHSLESKTTTNTLGHATRVEYDVWGNQTASVDPNGRRTEACYDGWGRVRYVYGPLDPKPAGQHYVWSCDQTQSSVQYEYYRSQFAPPHPAVPGASWNWSVRTWTRANGSLTDSWEVYDGLGRIVQTKRRSPSNSATAPSGAILTRTAYDQAGRVVKSSEPFFSASAALEGLPSIDAAVVNDVDIPTDHRTTYDAAGRVTSQQVYDNNVLLRQSTSSYNGATTTVTAMFSGPNPYGATATTVDAYGRTIKVVEDVGGALQAETRYAYTMRDEVAQITLPGLSANPSTYEYNYLGWQTKGNDNDRGAAETVYYRTGQVFWTRDAANQVVFAQIDPLGRTTHTYAGAMVATRLLSSFTYDPAVGGAVRRGAVGSASSYQPPGQLAFVATATAFDSADRITNTRVAVPAADSASTTLDDKLDYEIDLGAFYNSEGSIATETMPGGQIAGNQGPALPWSLGTPETLTYTYGTSPGQVGLVTSVVGASPWWSNVSYDSIGRLSSSRLLGGSSPMTVTRTYQPEDGRLSSIAATYNTGANAGQIAVREVYGYDAAGMVRSITRDPLGTGNDERECFYYDSSQRLERGLTQVSVTAGCPAAPTNATAATGPAPYNDAFAYDLRDGLTNNDGRGYTMAADTTAMGLSCTAATETTKPNAVSATLATGTYPGNAMWYDCNGSMMTRSSTTAPNSTRTAYAYDANNRLVATVEGWPVTWTGAVGAAVSSPTGDLVGAATLNGSTYAGGARSTENLTGDGSVSFRSRPAGSKKMIGLNNVDASQNFTEIDYAVQLESNFVNVYESGVQRCGNATCRFIDDLSQTDVITIERTGSTVRYLRNGVVFYTSGVAASGTYFVDTAFADPNARIGDVTITAARPVTWTNRGGVSVDAATGDLVAAGVIPGTGSGASTVQKIDGDGRAEFRFRQTPAAKSYAGLNVTDANKTFGEIDYAIYQDGASTFVYESGAQRCRTASSCAFFTNATATDLFAIERTGTTVRYLRNGLVFYTSAVAATAASYVVDTTFVGPNTRLGDVRVFTGSRGTTRYVYDAAGKRVMRVDGDGTKTIFLGSTELRWSPASPGTVKVARHYPGGTYRDFNGAITHTVTGYQGTVVAGIDAAGNVSHNRYLPYGGQRSGAAVDDKTFLGQTQDPVGLMYLNNRYQDPSLGIFLSVDPLVAATSEAYVYASGNPTTLSDPAGLAACEDDGNCPWSAGQACSRACAGPGGGGRRGDAIVSSSDTTMLGWALNHCAVGIGICQRDVADGRAGGHIRLAVDFLLAAQDAGVVAYRDGLLYALSVTGDLTGSIAFATQVSDGVLSISMVTADLPSAAFEDVLAQVGTVFNILEIGALSLCGATGAACAAVPIVSGVSLALDAGNTAVDGAQRDWGEFSVGVANIAGGQLVGLGAKGWTAPTSAMSFAGPIGARTATTGAPLGTSGQLFEAYIGGTFKGSIMAAEGIFSAGEQSVPYQLLQMTYAL